MPVAVNGNSTTTSTIEQLKSAVGTLNLKAPALNLREYASFETSPAIGVEFSDVPSKDGKPVLSIRDVLEDDEKLRALGRLVSERGVVFFRDAIISAEEQKDLVDKLGKFGGKPETSGLHVHPLTTEGSELGDEISVISNKFVFSKGFDRNDFDILSRSAGKTLWHSDITFEPIPSDYASLQIRTLPNVGGDTLWASAYEAYDRLSPAYQKFLEGLTATHIGQGFIDIANRTNATFREKRGSPENVGQHLSTVHPVIRVNPVTGWKGLFVNRGFTKRINELTAPESEQLLNFLFEHISSNHDLQTRFRWTENALAIWDNRSTFHAATHDLDNIDRVGTRSVSLGERPYFDPNALSRREALRQQEKK